MTAECILVVDDDEGVLGLARAALSRPGRRVLTTDSPIRALRMVEQLPHVDAVISDIVMPEMSGVELVARIQKISPATSVALMSGYTADLGEMAVPLLGKPFPLSDLINVVESLLKNTREARSRRAS